MKYDQETGLQIGPKNGQNGDTEDDDDGDDTELGSPIAKSHARYGREVDQRGDVTLEEAEEETKAEDE